MKKIFTLLATFLYVASVLAASETVYFVNADNWTGTINAYAWTTSSNANWPGVAATKEAEQLAGCDVYSYTAEAGTYANVIFNNGSKQTADLKWTADKYFVRDGWYTKEEAAVKLGQPIEYESVYFVNTDGWNNVKIYTWSPSLGDWPGIDMKKETETIGGKEVWSHTEMKGASFGGIIFNNGNGTQTADLKWTAGKYYVTDGWYTKEEAEAKLSGSNPVDPQPKGTYYITGNDVLFGTNAWQSNAIAMTEDEGVYTHTFAAVEAGVECQFKITDGTWDASWGFADLTTVPTGVTGNNDNNIIFTLAEAGDVVVTFSALKITITGNFSDTGNTIDPAQITYVLMGVGGDWTTGIELTKNETATNVEYQLLNQVISEGDSVKVVTLTAGVATAWCGNVDEASPITYVNEEKNGNILLVPGTYDFYYKVNTDNIYICPSTQSAIDNVELKKNATKYIQNGQLYIIRDNVRYNIMGQVVK